MSESRTIHQRLAAIMREAGPIGKDSVNKSQGFNFRGIDAVMNHLHPIFAKHGVTVLPEVLAERHEDRTSSKGGCLIYRVLTVRFNFVGEGGDSAAATVIGEGMDSGDKAANKAMAVALKYALTQLLLLPYDEVDPDGESHEPSRPRSAAPASIRPPSDKPTPQPPSGDGGETVAEIVLGEVRTKTGKTDRGEWVRYYSKADDGQFYATFDRKIGAEMQRLAAIGDPVLVTYRIKHSDKGDSADVLAIEPCPPPDAGRTAETASDDARDDADAQRKGQREMPF